MPRDVRPTPLDLSASRRVHIVGIGGAGMSAIAMVLQAMGHEVTGSDLKASSITERLRAAGIEVAIGHSGEHVGAVDLVTASPAVPADNPELAEAARRGVRLARRAEVLAAIASTKRTLAVAGTHGKTTTASMTSLILAEAGLHPSFLIGADVNEIGTNAAWAEGEWLVLEADESYGTFEQIHAELAVLTSVEPDHLDYYGTFDALEAAFGRYLASASGVAVVSADDPLAAALGRRHGARSVGTTPGADYPLRNVSVERSAVAFDLSGPEGPMGRLEVPVPGLYNAANAALAAVGAILAGASFDQAASALARFTGVPRRFEFRGEAAGVTFVDDYAHLPGEVRAALAAARAGQFGRVVAVFQPHRYTRTAALAESFGTAFADADVVVVTDVYGAGDPPVPGVSGMLVAEAVRAAEPHKEVHYAGPWEELRRTVARVLTPGDLCLTLGAGDLTLLPDELLAARA